MPGSPEPILHFMAKTVAVIVDLHVPPVVDVHQADLHRVRPGMLTNIHLGLHRRSDKG